MTDDFDDLAAPDSRQERAARRREAAAEAERQADIRKAAIGKTKIDEKEFFMPVGVNFLVRVLRMDSQTIRTRLRNVQPVSTVGGNRPVWYFHDVLPHLVKPKMTAEQFARSLNKADLPPEINNAFWAAQRARVRYKIESQEAWETDDVLKVLGEAAMELKDALTMAPEEMRQRCKLNDEQVAALEAMLDEMRLNIHERLVGIAERGATMPMFKKPLFGVSNDINTEPDIPEDWDTGDEDDE